VVADRVKRGSDQTNRSGGYAAQQIIEDQDRKEGIRPSSEIQCGWSYAGGANSVQTVNVEIHGNTTGFDNQFLNCVCWRLRRSLFGLGCVIS